MSIPRRFLVKVNAHDCPDGAGQPKEGTDWEGEGKNFKTGKPQQSSRGYPFSPEQSRNPDPGDRLLMWVNETGLTATAEVAVFHSDDETLAVRRVVLLPNPHFNKADLLHIKPAAVPALRDLASSRVVPLRFLTPDGWGAILEEA
jgi:hypothetical protein